MATTLIRRSPRPVGRRVLHAGLALGAAFSMLSPQPAVAAPAKAASGKVIAECSWDRPGHDKYSGDVPSAVDRYPDIPADVRARLRQRMVARDYDDMVSIRRDSIAGKRDYGSEIRDMHFGAGNVCRTVTRAGWSAQMHERGMVYCDSGHCILVPTVCRNVSRIVRSDGAGPVAASPRSGSTGEGESPADAPHAGQAAPEGGGGMPAGSGGDGGQSFASRSGHPAAGNAWSSPWSDGPEPGMHVAQQGRAGPLFESNDAYAARVFSPGTAVPAVLLRQPALDAALPSAAAVPEPQTRALLAGGLALLGAITRRRWRDARSPTAR